MLNYAKCIIKYVNLKSKVGDNDSLDLRLLRALLLDASMEFEDTTQLSYASSSIDTISNVHIDLRSSLYR